MKLSAFLLAAFASACIAQAPKTTPLVAPSSGPDSAAGIANCPVVLTSAWLAPRVQLLRSGDTSGGNGIDLEFRNASGKEIRSMELSARILVKKSIYDLNYLPPVQLHLTATGIQTIDAAFAQLRRLALPTELHPSLVEGVTLEQVTFEDGSVWSPRDSQHCGLTPGQTLPVTR